MSFAHYLLQVNLYLFVFYGFYKLLLDKETYFLLNRIYLVASGVLSLSIPFIRMEWITRQDVAQKVYTSINWDAVLEQAIIVPDHENSFSWSNIFVLIYFTGILFFLFRLVLNLLTVKKLIHSAKSGSAFSFFNKKVIDQQLPLSNVIHAHEDAHVKQWHTLDILFFELLGILTWINPVIYFYKKSIKNIHEFLADQHAAAFQGDKAEYAMLILSQSFGIMPNSLTNGFFDQSLIKKRIFMLQKEKSKKAAILKYGFFIPLFALLIIFSSATVRKNKNLLELSDQIPLDKPIEMVKDIVISDNPSAETLAAEKSIAPEAGKMDKSWKDFYAYLSRTIKYPTAARSQGLQGNTQIRFQLKNHKIVRVASLVNLGSGCDEEVMNAVSSYTGFKNAIDGNYAIKVEFRLDEGNSKIKNLNSVPAVAYTLLPSLQVKAFANQNLTDQNYQSKDKVFDFVSIDQQPEFPGGIEKFYQYLGKNIKYPKMAVDNHVSGKVFLSFIVEKSGDLSDVQITRGLGSGTDEEAIRVISQSPKWNPGIANDKPVRVKYNINVNFNLAKSNEPSENPTPARTQKLSLRSTGNNNDTKFIDGIFNGLIIVDGIKLADNKLLNKINPANIESVSILKNQAATSLYGLEAKEGAMLITTKNSEKNLFRDLNQKESTIDKNTTVDYLREKF